MPFRNSICYIGIVIMLTMYQADLLVPDPVSAVPEYYHPAIDAKGYNVMNCPPLSISKHI